MRREAARIKAARFAAINAIARQRRGRRRIGRFPR
jgi:hypothetical protein